MHEQAHIIAKEVMSRDRKREAEGGKAVSSIAEETGQLYSENEAYGAALENDVPSSLDNFLTCPLLPDPRMSTFVKWAGW
jgi:hypothetical protein